MTHGSLFSGIGGFDLAALAAGYTNVWTCEKDPFCQDILRKRFPESELYEDIKQVGWSTVKPVDVISGGFPCQPFSYAGKRRGTNDDRYLWPEMLNVIQTIKPSWVIGENVFGFVNLALDESLADLEAIGYEAWAFVVPAAAVNAWHRRDRVWIVANAVSGESKRQQFGGVFGHFTARCRDWDTDWREVAPRVCRMVDGLPDRLDRPDVQPDGGRATKRAKRLKALGNSIVPQIPYYFFEFIKEINETTSGVLRG